jgi:hypothetical protein
VFERLDSARQIHYYADTPAGVLEVRGATIHNTPDVDRRGDPQGYFFAGRLWDDEAVKRLEPLTGFKVRLLRGPVELAEAHESDDEDGTTIRLYYRLLGMDTRNVGAFAFARPSPALAEMLQTSRRAVMIVAVAAAVLLALLFWALHVHLTAPLSAVAFYLAGPAPQWLGRLSRAGSEFRRIGVMLEAAARAQQERAALSAILADVSRPLRRREVLEVFARGMQERLQVPGGVVLVPAGPALGGDTTRKAGSIFPRLGAAQAAPGGLHCGMAWGMEGDIGDRIAAGYAGLLPASASAGSIAAASGIGYVGDDPALSASGLRQARPDWAVRRVVPAGGRGCGARFGAVVRAGGARGPAGGVAVGRPVRRARERARRGAGERPPVRRGAGLAAGAAGPVAPARGGTGAGAGAPGPRAARRSRTAPHRPASDDGARRAGQSGRRAADAPRRDPLDPGRPDAAGALDVAGPAPPPTRRLRPGGRRWAG